MSAASVLATCFVAILPHAKPEPPERLGATAQLPVREVTVFKDGHAFVLHESTLPTNSSGHAVLDYLPTPVLGTFWPYSADEDAKLTSVVAGNRKVVTERPAANLWELLMANVGAEVIIHESNRLTYSATILGTPMHQFAADAAASDGADDEATAPPGLVTTRPGSAARPVAAGAQAAGVILLKTEQGVKVVGLDRIQDVTFKEAYSSRIAETGSRNVLTLHLDWAGKPKAAAHVGLVYVQKGIRWIPHYKVTLDGNGSALVQLQASLINELTDLKDATANLVIGVPTFAFKDTPDPISLQQTFAQLSPYFQQGDPSAGALGRAIMTQTARMSEYRDQAHATQPQADAGPELADAASTEDLFVFTVKHVTLKKGERMVLPVTEFRLSYKDIFTLELPFAPPPEVRANFNTQQHAELARLLAVPKVMHKIRLTNESDFPLTTGPALLIRDGRVLAQGMMTYTSISGTSDLEITAAMDIRVDKSDVETKRTPNAANWNGSNYARTDLAGKITLTNYRDQPVDLEVVRHVLGNVDSADHDGQVEQTNVFEDRRYLPAGDYPHWWTWYNWPHWWYRFNGVGRVTWKLTLGPDKSVDLGYGWHYYWQ
jgi:hypothetical protein